MMSLRRHVVVIAGLLLALALGAVLGASALSGRALGALTADRDELVGQVVALRGDRAAVDTRLRATESLVATGAPSTVAGVLPDQGVAVVVAPGAEASDVESLSALVTRAGGRVTARLVLTDAALAPDRADALRALLPRPRPAGAERPTTSTDTDTDTDPTDTDPTDTDPTDTDPTDTDTDLALVVTGGGADPARDGALARLTGELDRAGAGAVLAGRTGSGAVGVIRADPGLRGVLSTVDGVEGPASQVAAVLALREQAEGRIGLYGPVAGTFTPQTRPVP